MANEEKAREIANEYCYWDDRDESGAVKVAIEMAEWKDKQFKEFKNLVKEFLHDCDMVHCFKNMFWPIELQGEIEKYL